MKTLRQTVRDVISERVLPWIERDGISRMILPEEITHEDCAKPIKCRQLCDMRHHEHEIGIGLAGEGPYCIDNKRYIFKPGRMVFVPAGTLHTCDQAHSLLAENVDPGRPSSVLWLTIYPFGVRVQFSRIMVESDSMESTQSYMLLDWHMSRLANWLLEELRLKPHNYARVGRCILMELMERCLRAEATVDALDIRTRSKSVKSDTEQSTARIHNAQDFIHSNYHMSIGLDDIAAAAGISINHLGRQFKVATGMTPIHYLQNVRMEAARELLLTDLKIAEVAHLVGIEDPYYFSRVFRRINGFSPLAYRKNRTV